MSRVYVKRDDSGEITMVAREPGPDMTETLDGDDPAVHRFLHPTQDGDPAEVVEALERSDAEFVRVVEDLANLLIQKGVIQFTELPKAAQQKLLERRQLRRDRQRLDLLAGTEDNGDDPFMP